MNCLGELCAATVEHSYTLPKLMWLIPRGVKSLHVSDIY